MLVTTPYFPLNFFGDKAESLVGLVVEVTSEGPILVLLVFSDPKHDYVLHVLCERGRQVRALTRWDVRGKVGSSQVTGS
jgi:hypothetical protein